MRIHKHISFRRVTSWMLVGAILYTQAAVSLSTWVSPSLGMGIGMGVSEQWVMLDSQSTIADNKFTGVTAQQVSRVAVHQLQAPEKGATEFDCSLCCCAMSDSFWQPEISTAKDPSIFSAPMPSIYDNSPQYRPPQFN